MSPCLLCILCVGLPILVLLMGLVFGPLRRLLVTRNRRERNRLALVPVAPRPVQPAPYDPLEASSWHKGIRAHIRHLARYVHVPPDLDDGGMPQELHCHMQVLAMLQELSRAGQLQRPIVAETESALDVGPVTARVRNQRN